MIFKPSPSFGKYLLKMPGNLVIQISNFFPVWADMIDSNLASPGGAPRTAPWSFHPDKESVQTRLSPANHRYCLRFSDPHLAFVTERKPGVEGEKAAHLAGKPRSQFIPPRKTAGGQEAAERDR